MKPPKKTKTKTSTPRFKGNSNDAVAPVTTPRYKGNATVYKKK